MKTEKNIFFLDRQQQLEVNFVHNGVMIKYNGMIPLWNLINNQTGMLIFVKTIKKIFWLLKVQANSRIL